jgi:hypothetical protein
MSKPEKKPHKVVCISMYLSDIELAEQMINGLKREGFTKMNRSRLIRLALDQFDLTKLRPEDNHR